MRPIIFASPRTNPLHSYRLSMLLIRPGRGNKYSSIHIHLSRPFLLIFFPCPVYLQQATGPLQAALFIQPFHSTLLLYSLQVWTSLFRIFSLIAGRIPSIISLYLKLTDILQLPSSTTEDLPVFHRFQIHPETSSRIFPSPVTLNGSDLFQSLPIYRYTAFFHPPFPFLLFKILSIPWILIPCLHHTKETIIQSFQALRSVFQSRSFLRPSIRIFKKSCIRRIFSSEKLPTFLICPFLKNLSVFHAILNCSA